MPSIHTPKTVAELVKLIAKHGRRALLVSGMDFGVSRSAAGKVLIDLTRIGLLNDIAVRRDRVTIGTGVNFGRLSREAEGENGLIRQTASILANPLVRNRVTLLQALDPESPYFDITTPLVLLESKVRLQSRSHRRTVSIREFLEIVTEGLKKGEIPVAVDFPRLPRDRRTGFFRVARKSRKGSVAAAASVKIVRTICVEPEIVVSSLTLIPLRAKRAEKEIADKPASEELIKRAAAIAADEILALSDSSDGYERTVIEIAVARTLRGLM